VSLKTKNVKKSHNYAYFWSNTNLKNMGPILWGFSEKWVMGTVRSGNFGARNSNLVSDLV